VKKGAGILPGKRTNNQTNNAQCGYKIKGGRQEMKTKETQSPKPNPWRTPVAFILILVSNRINSNMYCH